MSDKLQKPYEISIWEDVLVEEEDKSYYKEIKIATIGSDQMTAPSRTSNPIFTQNVNGEITLTFDMVHKYYDSLLDDYIVNPLEKYLINERKVKLWYDDEWYDFVIKTCEETSDSNVFSYTAKGLFVNELGKVGYSIVLSNDLMNNQGTIFELGEKAIKGTDWVIDKENSDIIQQFVAEPLYRYKIDSSLVVKDLQTNEEVTIEANETLFLFYSTISNKQTENVFFLRENDYVEGKTLVDSNNVAKLPNYSFLEELVYNTEDATQITIESAQLTRETTATNSTGINYSYQGYRLAYNQQISFDNVKNRPVTLYEAKYEDGSTKTIYKYTDYEYVTSNVVTNFMSNGSNFNIYQDGSLEGWSTATPNEKVAFERAISKLIIGDDLGESFTIKDFKQTFTNLHFNLQIDNAVEGQIVTSTYNYKILTVNGSFDLIYNWSSEFLSEQDCYNESIQITVTIGGNETIYNYTPLSADVTNSISGIGTIVDTIINPNNSVIKNNLLSGLDNGMTFLTSAENGKYILQPLDLITYPNITSTSILDLTQLSGIKGYLRTQFRDISGRESGFNNTIFNDGIGEYRSQIENFSKGEEYVFRISYGITTEDGGQPQLLPGQAGKIKAIIAKYAMVPQTIWNEKEQAEEQIYLYTPDIDNILFEFDGPFELKNNVVTGGYFKVSDTGVYTTYYKDGISIAPSVDNCYQEIKDGVTIEKVWDTASHSYIDINNNFLSYYHTTAVCQKAISNTILADSADDYGIFLYIDDSNFISTKDNPIYFYIKDVQLFKKKLDGDGQIVLIGNIPKATAISTDFYYLKPEEDTDEASIETFSSIESIAESLGLDPDNDIKPLYNENFEKISSIEASQSNCFNIIQDLCEAFECWARFDIDHDENGAIRLNADGAPSKKISFHQYSGDNNFAGFKYGINLESINRTIESDEFVSKLIVEQVENDTVDGGVVSIASAPSNPSGESYILNMSYYLKHGLIENPQQYYIDYNNFIEQLKDINSQYTLNKNQLQLSVLARTKTNANVNVYHELVEEAEKKYTEALFEFKDLTGIDYSEYTQGNGYYINFYLKNNGNNFYGVYSKFVEAVIPSYFDIDGNEIILNEKSRKESTDTITVEYEISNENIEPYTLTDIKYVCIVNEIENFDVLGADGGYTNYISKFNTEVPPAIIAQFTKYIWEFNHSVEDEYYYHPATEEDRLKRTVNIVPSSNHETLTNLVGKIYTNQQVINEYTPLLQMSKTEKADLDLLIDGTKDYVLTVSTISKTVEEVEYNTTKEVLDDYVEGLVFSLVNGTSTYDVKTTTTEKSFTQDNLYDTIIFRKYPNNYQLKYTINGKTKVTSDLVTIKLPVTGTKVFTLVPINEQKGIKDVMKELLDQKDEVEAKFYKKYSRYIQEGSWTSSDYIDNELYYLDALNVSATSAQPKVSYDLSVYEISEQAGFENYNFKVGDKTYIEDTQFFGYRSTAQQDTDLFEVTDNKIYLLKNVTDVLKVYKDIDHAVHFDYDFNNHIITVLDEIEEEELYVDYIWEILTPIQEEVVVSEVEWHLDNTSENSIKIQNYKTQFDDLFQRVAAAVQSVEYNSATYSRAASVLNEEGLINAGLLLKSLNSLAGGLSLSGDDTIIATEDGIVVKDTLDPMRQMKIAGAGLKTSTDGGYNWNTIATAEGLTIDTIDTQNVIIKDGDNPSFRWDKYGLNAYGYNSNQTDLKTYVRYDKYGLYGIQNGENFQAQSLNNIKETAQFGLLWDGFFIKNSYTDGYVSISSDNDFQVVANDQERIKIGALEKTPDGYEYGIRITNAKGENVFVTDDSGDIEMSGVINAKGGTFTDSISVGSGASSIILQGTEEDAVIGSSDYFDDTSKGWAIKSNGDAVFNNITARGAIKTAVFEYEEIEAVGGIFLFRPSSTIRGAYIPIVGTNPGYTKTIDDEVDPDTTYYEYDEQNDTYVEVINPTSEDLPNYYVLIPDNQSPIYSSDLIVKVENPLLFSIGDWCKVSNYTPENSNSAATNNGLINIYEVTDISNGELTLANGAQMFEDILSYEINSLVGGALISFANYPTHSNTLPALKANYGIGINSSDDSVNLPARAISLFETEIHPENSVKVSYNLKGILGTLPPIGLDKVSILYDTYLKNKQGIFTNNMYIGDNEQYLAFYTDGNGDTQLRLVAKSFEILPDDGDLIDLGNSIVEEKIQYTLSTSTTVNTVEEPWQDTPYSESSGYYLWQRTYIKYANSNEDYLPNEDGYYLAAGQPGPAGPAGASGEDAVVLTIDSSNGNIFKNNSVNTQLTITIYKGTTIITNITQLKQIFGNTAFIQWYWKRINDNTFYEISTDDPMLSNNGFTLTLTPDKVDTKVVFQCEIKTIE